MKCRLTNSPPGPHENRRLSGKVAPGTSVKTTVVQVSENTFPSWACHTSSAVQAPKKEKHSYKYLFLETMHCLFVCVFVFCVFVCTPVVQFEKLDVAVKVSQSQQLLTLEDSHDAIA